MSVQALEHVGGKLERCGAGAAGQIDSEHIRKIEDRVVCSVHGTVGHQQHAQRFLRLIQREPRGLHEAVVGGHFLLRTKLVQAAAAAALLQLARQIEMRASRVACALVGVDDAAPRDDGQICIGRGERCLAAGVGGAQIRDVRCVLGLRPPRPHRRGVERRAEVEGRHHTVPRGHGRPLKLDGPSERRRRHGGVDLRPRARACFGEQRLGAEDAGGGDRRRGVLLDRAPDRIVEGHLFRRHRRLRVQRDGRSHQHGEKGPYPFLQSAPQKKGYGPFSSRRRPAPTKQCHDCASPSAQSS